MNPSHGDIYRIEIYNSAGQKIYSDMNTMQRVENEIDISDHGRGIYFIKCIAGDKIGSGKVVVK